MGNDLLMAVRQAPGNENMSWLTSRVEKRGVMMWKLLPAEPNAKKLLHMGMLCGDSTAPFAMPWVMHYDVWGSEFFPSPQKISIFLQ